MTEEEPVRLRAIRNADSEALFRWVNDPGLARFSAPYRPIHEPAHEAWLHSLADDPSMAAFAIEERDTGKLVGLVQLVDIHPVHRNAEMRIRIGEPGARGRGLGGATLRLLLDHAWRDLGLHRVYAYVFADNPRAVASYAQVGFVEEGRMREAAYIDGAWCDLLIVGVLRRDAE
jgi:RimJ/RimL family protein N-acetyltransferase